MANARALVIDLRKLQLGFVIYNLYNGLQLSLTRKTHEFSESQLPYTFFLEGYRWVMDFKATAWRRVLIAQFEDYF